MGAFLLIIAAALSKQNHHGVTPSPPDAFQARLISILAAFCFFPERRVF